MSSTLFSLIKNFSSSNTPTISLQSIRWPLIPNSSGHLFILGVASTNLATSLVSINTHLPPFHH